MVSMWTRKMASGHWFGWVMYWKWTQSNLRNWMPSLHSKVSQAFRPGIHGGQRWPWVREWEIAGENLAYASPWKQKGCVQGCWESCLVPAPRSLLIIFEEPRIPLPTAEMLHLYLKRTERTAQATADCPVTLQSLGKKLRNKFPCMIFLNTWIRSRQLWIISTGSPRINNNCEHAWLPFFDKRMVFVDGWEQWMSLTMNLATFSTLSTSVLVFKLRRYGLDG